MPAGACGWPRHEQESEIFSANSQHKNPSEQSRYIQKCLQDIRDEARAAARVYFSQRPAAPFPGPLKILSPAPQVKSTDIRTKAIAIEKLCYLHMLGYDMGWASFHIVEVRGKPAALQRSRRNLCDWRIRSARAAPASYGARRELNARTRRADSHNQFHARWGDSAFLCFPLSHACPARAPTRALFVPQVMSSQKLKFKHLGYASATQCFHGGTDVMLLIPNLLKKARRRAQGGPAPLGTRTRALCAAGFARLPARLHLSLRRRKTSPQPPSRRHHPSIQALRGVAFPSPRSALPPPHSSSFTQDLASPVQAEAGLAIDCLANIITPDLAQTLVADIHALLNSPRTYVRRKAALALYKCFLHYPDSLRPSFARLTERLEDDDPGVVSSVVSVLCELATHNPRCAGAPPPPPPPPCTPRSNPLRLFLWTRRFFPVPR